MSLSIYLTDANDREVYSDNCTHNLIPMAEEAGVYDCLWRPAEHCFRLARDLVRPLREGLCDLIRDPDKFEALNPENGWGNYWDFVEFVFQILKACHDNPEAYVTASV